MDTTPPPVDCVHEYYPLAPHTLYRIGGPARWAFLPGTADEAKAAYAWMLNRKMPVLIIGAGSNMLIDDKGFPGGVLFTTELKSIETLGSDRYRSGAGVPLADIVASVMLPHNYAGVGALTGIPGTLGGALCMNAGTVNGSICQFSEAVTLLTPEGVRTVLMEPALYGYRSQTFCGGHEVILDAILTFIVSDRDESEVYEHYIRRRRETQPQGWCCGSVFKNPPDNHAGRLIESCGLKGTRQGGAVISEKHANFIMNEDNASFEDVLGLIQLVKDTVYAHHRIRLEEEVRIIRS